MNQNLKQRLVGLAVLTSLLVIFLPMLFDNPINETDNLTNQLTIPDVPISLLPSDAENNIKTIDDVIKLPKPKAIKESTHEKQTASKMIRWFIQIGIFSQESNAILLRDKIRQQGFPVTIKVVSREKDLVYKVNVGPELDQKRAEVMKAKIAKLNNIKGMLSSTAQ